MPVGNTLKKNAMNANNLRFGAELVNGIKIFYREAGNPQKPKIRALCAGNSLA